MSIYTPILPKDFTKEQANYISNFRKSVMVASEQTDLIFGFKDINSRHISATDAYAKIVGLKNGKNVAGLLDKDMPCEGTASYADCYVQEDLSLINSLGTKKATVLNIHKYSDGLKARIFKKYTLNHAPSQSILGVVYVGHNLELENVLKIIPNYIIRFGITGSIESGGNDILVNQIKLTDYEQEICFLFLLNWEFKQIADFMNNFRPLALPRTADTIIKKKNYLCSKFDLKSSRIKDLQDFLVSIGFHNKMPTSFYDRIIGSKLLRVE